MFLLGHWRIVVHAPRPNLFSFRKVGVWCIFWIFIVHNVFLTCSLSFQCVPQHVPHNASLWTPYVFPKIVSLEHIYLSKYCPTPMFLCWMNIFISGSFQSFNFFFVMGQSKRFTTKQILNMKDTPNELILITLTQHDMENKLCLSFNLAHCMEAHCLVIGTFD
jgi:hypothetical protein